MFTLREIREIVRSAPLGSFALYGKEYFMGRNAYFIPGPAEWGIKFYFEKERRDKTYSRQLKAAAMGLAPSILNPFHFNVRPYGNCYGYLTEIAKIYHSGPPPAPTRNRLKKILDGYDELIYKLEKIGIPTGDLHGRNIGYLSDGRLVAIDFDYDGEYSSSL